MLRAARAEKGHAVNLDWQKPIAPVTTATNVLNGSCSFQSRSSLCLVLNL